MPDDDLLSHSECYTTIGTDPFHFCVRNGNRWFRNVIFIRQSGLKIQSRFQSVLFRPLRLPFPFFQASARLSGRCMAKTLGSLVQVRSAPRSASTPCLSTSSSLTVLTDSWSGKTHLRARFPLRCFQRLSIPNVATGQCHWHDNPYTSGSFTPVLSY